ncbi:MAG: PKD domain-containing protein [Candidatus Kapaibacterium sp.]
MRSGHYRYRLLLAALLLAGVIPSCKSPISTTPPPAFTLILPDSAVKWGDSATMIVSSTAPLSATSIYTWSFGDSSSLLSRSDTIIHYYLNPGDFSVKVDLSDTSNHHSLGTQSETVHVVARHFDLALLQSMKYVTITWQSKTSILIRGYFNPGPCPPFFYNNPLQWNDTMFSMDYNFFVSDSPYGKHSGESSIYGNADMNFTQLEAFSIDTSSYSFLVTWNGTPECNQTYDAVFRTTALPFKTESDTDVVFEAAGDLTKNASFHSTFSTNLFTSDTQTISSDFTNSTVDRHIIIRFHK